MKHNVWSRLLSVVLAVMMIASIVPSSAFAEAASEITSQATTEVATEEEILPEETADEGSEEQPAQTTEPEQAEPAPTEEPVAEPTEAPATESEQPSEAPAETVVPDEQPSAEPTAAPEATEAPNASAAPETSTTPAPSESPAPSASPAPTETPVPSASPEATEEPVVMNEEEYTAPAETADGIKVEVTVPAGTLPKDAVLKVDRVAEGSEEYENTRKTLEENGVEFDSFAALDIRFELNGEEVEPAHPVQVKIVANNVLPEDVDPATVAVQHLKENEDGTVTVENVAAVEAVDENTVQVDMPAMMAAAPAEEQAGEAQPAEEPGTVTAEGSELIAEFTVESFSKFTITGKNGVYLKVKYADVQGNEIQVKNPPSNFTVSKEATYNVQDWERKPSNQSLTFIGAYLDFVPDGTKYPVKYVKYSDNNWYYKESDNTGWKLTPYQGDKDKGTIWFLYGSETYDVPVDENRVKDQDDGINIDLFDYKSNFNEQSVKNSWDFYFVGDGVMDPGGRTAVNSYVGGAFALQGIVENKLENDFPVLSTNKEQMDFLFGEANKTHDNLTGLFKEDENGYYVYDSKENFASVADAAKENGEFTVYEYPYGDLDSADSPHFLPYNDIVSTSENSFTKDTIVLKDYEAANYHFGMTMDFNFIQPKQGLVNGKNMVFEFDGDDDVWVFIDDVLVLDLGGIHGSVHGSIDFSTGKVIVDDAAVLSNGSFGDHTGRETTLRALFEDALGKGNSKIEEYFEEGSDTFKDYTSHTFKYYYLERGASGSNCKIKFNLNTIPAGTIDVEKQIVNAVVPGFADAKFTMQVLTSSEENGTYTPYQGTYKIYDENTKEPKVGYTEDGKFVLKNGEYARLGDNISETTWYKVKELKVENYDSDYTFSLQDSDMVDQDGSGVSGDIMGQSIGLQVGHTRKVVVKNTFTATGKGMFVLQKKMSEGQTSEETFTFEISNSKGDLYVGDYYVRPINTEGQLTEQNRRYTDKGIITLKQDEEAVISGVTSGSNIVVEEKVGSNYSDPTYSNSGYCTKVERQDGKYQVEINPIGETEKAVATVTCTNSYATGTLQITKTVSGLDDLSELKESLKFQVTGTSNGKMVYSQEIVPAEIDWNNNSVTVTLNKVPVGEYTVTETGHDQLELYNWVESQSTSSDNATVAAGVTGTVTLTNVYERATGSLKIIKNLKSDLKKGDTQAVFTFKITDPDGVVYFKTVTVDSSKTGSVTIDNLPAGNYKVEELTNVDYSLADDAANPRPAVIGRSNRFQGEVSFENALTGTGLTDDSAVVNTFEKINNSIVVKQKREWINQKPNPNNTPEE